MRDMEPIKLPGNEILWRGATSLSMTVYQLVRERKTESEDFKMLLSYYGKPKLRELYKQAVAEIKKKTLYGGK